MYFYNPEKRGVAHIWTDGDTACKMLNSGGMRRGNKRLIEEKDERLVCQMCKVNMRKVKPYVASPEEVSQIQHLRSILHECP